jgi:dipeptidyl aminopeptidase/acylaminoacyl peptidase
MTALCLALGCGDSSRPADTPPTLVATVHQYGPVGYRDPLGVISPDGRWLATAAHSLLQIQALAGGPVRRLPAAATRILHLAWRRDGRLLVGQQDGDVMWWLYDVDQETRQPFWPAGTILRDKAGISVDPSRLRELSWSPDGRRLAGIQLNSDSSTLWIVDSAGQQIQTRTSGARLGYPVWLQDELIGCLAFEQNRQRVTLPCGEGTPAGLETKEAYGPMAGSPDGHELYFATPNDRGFVSLWAWNLARGTGRQLAALPRDTYAPSVTTAGLVLFKDQDYWTEVAVLPADGGAAVRRTAFQAETPSWDPTGSKVGVTYGTWRRVVDDFRYPDIAQEAGIIAAEGSAPASGPDQIVQDSPSEDQGLSWSPNQRWIAFHSHQQASDDIWLRPADRQAPLTRITRLGRGAEVGWPRWSPDGRWIAFNGDSVMGGHRRSLLWIVGVDQLKGEVSVPARPVPVADFMDEVGHAEWLASSEEIVFAGIRAPGAHTLYRVARSGGAPRVIHSYSSTQAADGFGVSPDGGWLVFPQPDKNGRLQLFKLAVTPGARPEQLTSDSTEKTQPSVSPDGRRIAFTLWRYDARFWTVTP